MINKIINICKKRNIKYNDANYYAIKYFKGLLKDLRKRRIIMLQKEPKELDVVLGVDNFLSLRRETTVEFKYIKFL